MENEINPSQPQPLLTGAWVKEQIKLLMAPPVVPGFRNEPSPRRVRIYICAFCTKPGGTMVKINNLYFHEKCPKMLNPKLVKKEIK